MYKYLTLIALLAVTSTSMAIGMVGGPVFCIGERQTSMTVEVSKINMEVPISDASSNGLKEDMTSQRLFLTGRYGLASWLDVDVRLGTADLRFNDSPQGYTNYVADLSFAWGAGLRLGIPFDNSPYKFTLGASYTGYKPTGNSTKGLKTVSTNYLWQEVSPSVTFGYQLGKFVPYVGATKPFLFGKRDVKVVFNGQEFPTAGGKENYSDGKQAIRGLAGLEWKLPDGYSATAEVAGTTDGLWMFFIGFAQVIK
jgi:hypothetical protein